MDNKDRKIFNIYAIVIQVLLICILICGVICVSKLEKLDKRFDNLNQLIQDSSLIEINGELIDEDDYNQIDWRSYTPAKDSVE